MCYIYNFSISASEKYLDPSKLGFEQYQDIIINNKIINKGVRECPSRYDAIKKILDMYKRPITVLDLGASQGYFSFRIAHDYDSTVVMIENGYSYSATSKVIADQLLELCKLNTKLNNVIYLNTELTLANLKNLASCEHFDVVLGFNIIHHMKDNWKDIVETIFKLGDNILIETPPSDDPIAEGMPKISAIESYIINKNGTVITQTLRHGQKKCYSKMFWFKFVKNIIEQKYLLESGKFFNGTIYSIKSDFSEKKFYKKKVYKKRKLYNSEIVRDWFKGINLITFKRYNGIWPNKATIKKTILDLFENNSQHNDFAPWNMIIQGEKIKIIDDESYGIDFPAKTGLDLSLNFIDLDEKKITIDDFMHTWFYKKILCLEINSKK